MALVPEKYASMSRPVFLRNSADRPFSFSRSTMGAVRLHCQTIARPIASPVCRSQITVVSRWLVRPIASMSHTSIPARLTAWRSASTWL